MSKAMLFLPINKVDEEQRLVYGTMTQEVLDKSGEMFDYAGSKPYFEAWSDGIHKSSGGKSKGNVRVMHTAKVAGILTDIAYNDEGLTIEACAKILDDGEWEMAKAGGYTGFSIGGRYVKRFEVDGVKKFIADPAEVSLVDNPCVPSATFSLIKADGVTDEVPFHLWQPTNDQIAVVATELAKAAGDEKKWGEFIEPARQNLLLAKAAESNAEDAQDGGADEEEEGALGENADSTQPKGKKAKVKGQPDEGDKAKTADKSGAGDDSTKAAPVEPPSGEAGDWAQVWKTKDGKTFVNKADAVQHAAEIKAQESVDSNPLAKAIGSLKAELANTDELILDTPARIRAAWGQLPTVPTDEAQKIAFDKTVVAITAAWKDKIDTDGPPSLEKMALIPDVATGFAVLKAVEATILAKGLYQVGQTARALAYLAEIAQMVCWEEKGENDADSKLPQMSADLLSSMRTFLVEMVNEETAELLTQMTDGAGVAIEVVIADDEPTILALSAKVLDLVKADTVLLAKMGARHSKGDMSKIQAVHDHAAGLGAKCDAGNTEKADNDTDLAKFATLTEENKGLRKLIDDSLPLIEELRKDVAKLKDLPLPAAPRTHVVGKGEDNGGGPQGGNAARTAEALLEEFGPEELAKAAIKIAQRTPISINRG